MTEAPATTGDMHHTLYHATTVACDIYPEIDTPEGTPTGTPHTVTDVTHPQPDTLPTGVTLTATPMTTAVQLKELLEHYP